MAVTHTDSRRGSLLWSRLHFLVRLLGLLGAQVALAGLVLLRPSTRADLEKIPTDLDPQSPTGWKNLLVVAGVGALLFALLIETIVILRVVAGQRSALRANALMQALLALALLVGVNAWSFQKSTRFDWTREKQFTLPESVRKDLARLDPKSETTIVLYLRHRTSRFTSEKPDPFDLEAEQKIVEKVKDLVELFREVGPQFRIEVLDVGIKGFTDKRDTLTINAPELRKAIEEAPENSIFVHAGKAVQRLSFNEFYRLDRGQSEKQDNLVLRAVGPVPITRRVVNVEERKPRVGLLVFHEYLSSEGPVNLFNMAGARKALAAQGFDVRDVVLKSPNGEPAADALEISKFERLQDELDDLNTEVRSLEREIKLLERLVQLAPKGALADLNRLVVEYAEQFNPRFLLVRASESNREQFGRLFANQLAAAREGVELAREEQAKVTRDLSALSSDKLSEQKRLKDLRARLMRNVADVDLIILPRLTRLQSGDRLVDPSFYDLDTRHSQAIREFLRAGKPILACLGSTNTPITGGRPGERAIKPPDDLEKLFAEIGILFGKRTVVHNVEKRAFAGREESLIRATKPQEVPPLRLESAARTLAEELQQMAYTQVREPLAALGTAHANPLFAIPFIRLARPAYLPNAIRESLQLADQESGKRLDLKSRFMRPIFIDPLRSHRLMSDPEVLSTSAATWHDEQPFSTAIRPVPRFETPAPEDPDNGTLEARRRGPFTVGVAVETNLPESWNVQGKVRVAALGEAGLFTGAELTAGQERLLLDTCNWLLGREEQLARPAPEWSYPRVEMSQEARTLWVWGARLGLPELFAFFGLIMLLIRRLR
jgi:hypothetical protein